MSFVTSGPLAGFLGSMALAANEMGAPDLDLQPANAWLASST